MGLRWTFVQDISPCYEKNKVKTDIKGYSTGEHRDVAPQKITGSGVLKNRAFLHSAHAER